MRSLTRICDVDDPICLFFFDALPQRSHVGRVVRVPAVGLDHRQRNLKCLQEKMSLIIIIMTDRLLKVLVWINFTQSKLYETQTKNHFRDENRKTKVGAKKLTDLNSFGEHDLSSFVLFQKVFLVEIVDDVLHQVLVKRFATLDQWNAQTIVNLELKVERTSLSWEHVILKKKLYFPIKE